MGIEDILHAINSNEVSSKCFFIDGPGGTGKTFLYNTLIDIIRGDCGVIIPVASTGIAGDLLKGGKTVHSQFQLPLNLNENSVSSIKKTDPKANILRNCKLIIWDEAPMSTVHALNAVDKLLRLLMNNHIEFGGKCILLGGDFRQTLPVVFRGSKTTILENCI